MIRSKPEHFERGATPGGTRQMTADDSAIVNDLGHVAFMAWLIEARDAVDSQIMAELESLRSVPRARLNAIRSLRYY